MALLAFRLRNTVADVVVSRRLNMERTAAKVEVKSVQSVSFAENDKGNGNSDDKYAECRDGDVSDQIAYILRVARQGEEKGHFHDHIIPEGGNEGRLCKNDHKQITDERRDQE